MLCQCNYVCIYKYLKENTKTVQPKLVYCGLLKKKKKKKKKPNEQCCESVAKNVVDVVLLFS